jgi:transposase
MEKAIVDVRENGMSIKKAAFLYGLDRFTLINRIKKRYKTGFWRQTD